MSLSLVSSPSTAPVLRGCRATAVQVTDLRSVLTLALRDSALEHKVDVTFAGSIPVISDREKLRTLLAFVSQALARGAGSEPLRLEAKFEVGHVTLCLSAQLARSQEIAEGTTILGRALAAQCGADILLKSGRKLEFQLRLPFLTIHPEESL